MDEDWIWSQRQDLDELGKVASSCDELWILGDLFDTPRVSTECLNMVIAGLIAIRMNHVTVRVLPGNHDLPEHNYENIERCSLGVVLKLFDELKSGTYFGKRVSARPFGLDDVTEASKSDVWVTHQLTFPNESARPMADCGHTADELVAMSGCKRIFTGDYHHGFIRNGGDGSVVVTPGCLNIQVADMEEYVPHCVIWDTESDTYEEVTLNTIHAESIATEYLDVEKERDERLADCVKVVGDAMAVGLDFKGNLDAASATMSDRCKKVIGNIMDKLNKDKQ